VLEKTRKNHAKKERAVNVHLLKTAPGRKPGPFLRFLGAAMLTLAFPIQNNPVSILQKN
jgi:hypothetical protein